MKTLLAFCFFPAFRPASSGGEIRLFHLYEALSQHFHIRLITSSGALDSEQYIEHNPRFHEIRVPKDAAYQAHWDRLSPYAGSGDLSAPALIYSGRDWTRLHEVYLEHYDQADAIIHDFPFMVDFDLMAGLDQKPRIYNAHNCETQLYAALHPDEHSAPLRHLVQQSEQKLLGLVDAVWYCSDSDKQWFQALAPRASYTALFAPNGCVAVPDLVQVTKTVPQRAVFMGSAHLPNVEAARWVVEHLAPLCPQWHFDLLGSCWPAGSVASNVTAHGVVDEATKRQVLQQATVALNPMQSGSGSNVKVLDYFAHGVAVLSTPMGMRGIQAQHDKQAWMVDLVDFATQLQHIADEAHLAVSVAAQATALVQQYQWDVIAEPLVADLQQRLALVTRTEPTVLVLNDYDSFLSVGGGAVRTQGLYQTVSTEYTVIFLCLSNRQRLAVRQQTDRITVIEVPKTPEQVELEHSEYLRLAKISVGDLVSSTHILQHRLFMQLYGLLQKQADWVVVEHPYLTPVPIAFDQPYIYSSQNHETTLKRALLAEVPGSDEWLAHVAELEKNAVAKAVATVAVTDEDAQLLSQNQQSGAIFVVPNGALAPADPDGGELMVAKDMVHEPNALFLGSGHAPNVTAALFIVQQLAPACPQIQFHVVGSVCSRLPATVPPNVKVWGMVSEGLKTAILQRVQIALNPVESGSGSNIKLADSLANGLFTLSTEFGVRGYSSELAAHYCVADLADFAAVLPTLYKKNCNTPALRQQRQAIFMQQLSMPAQAKLLLAYLKQQTTPKRRLLFVTYRYTSPALGGAEWMFERLLRAADQSGRYQIDVVTTELSQLRSHQRYLESYSFDDTVAAPVGLKNTRFRRFALDVENSVALLPLVRHAWQAQPQMERALFNYLYQQQRLPSTATGLAWGWAEPELDADGQVFRWGFIHCALYVAEEGAVVIHGTSPIEQTVRLTDEAGQMYAQQVVQGPFVLTLDQVASGSLLLQFEQPLNLATDPRPLAVQLQQLWVNGESIALDQSSLCSIQHLDTEHAFNALAAAAESSRFGVLPNGAPDEVPASHLALSAEQQGQDQPLSKNIVLTEMRGPHSEALTAFLAEHSKDYDAIITHNSVFKPPIDAVYYAKQAGVPSVLIPHAHLDDDFYHFPDVLQAALDASLVLAAPKAACDFYAARGARTGYLPAGIDAHELFEASDVQEFEALCPHVVGPFVLVLGRKSATKGYQQVIDAAAQLKGQVHVVLIGPDDDGVVVDSPYATYLGRQSRAVVRGALQRCLALVTMSRSESFGIVLLDAWLASKPVIANTHCGAFHDMAVHDHNALLVDETELTAAIQRLLQSPELATRLGQAGQKITIDYDWQTVGEQFLKHLP